MAGPELHGAVTPEQARRRAQIERGRIADGIDPQEEREAALGKRGAVSTVNDLLDSHLELYVHRVGLRSEREMARCFTRYVRPALGKVCLTDLRRGHIVGLLDQIAVNNGPVMADRVLAHLRKALNWYAARDEDFIVPIVPGMALTKPSERARDRVLSDLELRALWKATEPDCAGPYGALVRTLLLTAQRPGEIGGMRWSHIEGDILTILKGNAKTKTVYIVALSLQALSLIDKQPETGPYIFGRSGTTPFSGYSKAKGQLDEQMRSILQELDPKLEWTSWQLRDLRRTSRSLMSRASVAADIAERVLNHALQGVRRVYDRHDYLDEKRSAVDALARLIDRILNPDKSVIDLSEIRKGTQRPLRKQA